MEVEPGENEGEIKYGKKTFIIKPKGVLTDDYHVISQLGKGGYGKVYELKHKKSGNVVACKQLSKLKIKDMDKFQREIQILKDTDHPNIIKLLEIYESQRSLYLVMEKCSGGELFDRIIDRLQSKNLYTEKDASIIFLQVMSAIKYCHNNGICHRDIKPENLLYLNAGDEKDNPIKVIDFGLSQTFENPQKRLFSKVGTAYYVAPEILRGDYTCACDIWSAGVILYILLSGEPPFNGPNDQVIYSNIEKMTYTFPDKKWSRISDQAKDLIRHMLLPEEQRYTADQVLKHEWFSAAKKFSSFNLYENLLSLQNFGQYNLIKKMTLNLIGVKLGDSEIKCLKENFKSIDSGLDGQITLSEFKTALNKLNINDNSKIEEIFKQVDTNLNNKIDYSEFIAASLDKNIYLKEEKLMEAFACLDINNDQKITKDELLLILHLDEKHSKEIEEIIKSVDKNNDGVIDYKEFLSIMDENKVLLSEVEVENKYDDEITIDNENNDEN